MIVRYACSSVLLTLLASCAAIGGSASGVDRTDETVGAMRELKNSLAVAPARIDAVSMSLATLLEEGGDMKAEFATFDDAVDQLETHHQEIRELRTAVEAQRETFTTEWRDQVQSISTTALERRAEERRGDLVQQFNELGWEADATLEVFDPWVRKVVDVRKYLEIDLNPAGITSVGEVAREVQDGTEEVKQKLNGLAMRLEEMCQSIAATSTPANLHAPAGTGNQVHDANRPTEATYPRDDRYPQVPNDTTPGTNPPPRTRQ